MIEIKFGTREDAVKAVKVLSKFSNPRIGKKLEFRTQDECYLNLGYDQASLKLKEAKKIIEKSMENGDNPAEYLLKALDLLKMLFESGKYLELVDVEEADEIEDKLFEVSEELKDIKNLKKEIEEGSEEFMKILSKRLEQTKEEDEELNFPPKEILIKIAKLNQMRDFLLKPIIESLFRHSGAEDPYKSFVENVYLNVTGIADFFEEDIRIKISSEVHVSYILNMDIGYIFQEEEFLNALSRLPILNEEVFDEVTVISTIAEEILSTLKVMRKAKYEKFVHKVAEKINETVYNTGDFDISTRIHEDVVEFVIKDLDRVGLIKTKGKRIIKYAT